MHLFLEVRLSVIYFVIILILGRVLMYGTNFNYIRFSHIDSLSITFKRFGSIGRVLSCAPF